jgi:hypothetical protein
MTLREACVGAALLAILWIQGRAPADGAALVEQAYHSTTDGLLSTDVFIDGQGPFNLILDTATSRTVIYEHVRTRLGLSEPDGEALTIHAITGPIEAAAVQLAELRLSSLRITDLVVGVVPDIPGKTDQTQDGILGLDVLTRYFVVLEDGRLSFYNRAGGGVAPYTAWPSVALSPKQLTTVPVTLWFLDARFGMVPGTALFDLGAGVTILNWPLARRFGLVKTDFSARRPLVGPQIGVRDIAGWDTPIVQVTEFSVAIGNREWPSTKVMVADAPLFGYLDMENRPAAIVGLGLFRNDSIAIDFESEKLYIRPPSPAFHRSQ